MGEKSTNKPSNQKNRKIERKKNFNMSFTYPYDISTKETPKKNPCTEHKKGIMATKGSNC